MWPGVCPRASTAAIPGTIGAGASSEVVAPDGHVYSLVETPTVTLMCFRGQYWPFVLVRAKRNKMGSGNWEHPTRAPIPLLEPESRQDPCSLQYARWVEDPTHGLFLIYWDSKNGHRLMKVENESSRTFRSAERPVLEF